MLEKENIMLDFINRIATHSDSPVVTEDWGKATSLKHIPQVAVVEGPDEVIDVGMSAGRTIYTRRAFVSTISFIAAPTEELKATVMRNFQANLRKVVYKDRRRRIGDYGGGIREKRIEQRKYLPSENQMTAQAIIWQVDYREDVGRLFEEVLPTE